MTSSCHFLNAELEDVRYVIEGLMSFEYQMCEYEVRSLTGGDIKKGDEVVYLVADDMWVQGTVCEVKTSSITTAEVVKEVIIPDTKGETEEGKGCYADKFPGGAKVPTTLMSHSWGNSFISLVKVSLIYDCLW